MHILIENESIDYTVHYGKGKKLTLQLDAFGFITVKAPNGTSSATIEQALRDAGDWILDKKREREAKTISPLARQYEPNGLFRYLGKEYPLSELIDTDGQTEEQLQLALKKFYFKECKTIINRRINPYQKELGVTPKVIDIVESMQKWGSCNSRKMLTFNYRLAMAPVDVIDYVIIHELCHLIHMNHDRSFWRRVGSIMPDYKEKEAYLARMNAMMMC